MMYRLDNNCPAVGLQMLQKKVSSLAFGYSKRFAPKDFGAIVQRQKWTVTVEQEIAVGSWVYTCA